MKNKIKNKQKALMLRVRKDFKLELYDGDRLSRYDDQLVRLETVSGYEHHFSVEDILVLQEAEILEAVDNTAANRLALAHQKAVREVGSDAAVFWEVVYRHFENLNKLFEKSSETGEPTGPE
jgi:hypothetical protein